jgi:hypothetical protein
MGVSLTMKVRVARGVFAHPVNITPGWRSRCVTILTERFGPPPYRLDREDQDLIETLAQGASVYTDDKDNVWKKIAEALNEFGGVEIEAEY